MAINDFTLVSWAFWRHIMTIRFTLKQHFLIMGRTFDVSYSYNAGLLQLTIHWKRSLRTHLKTHSGEKSNKCNQCDFASSQAGDLRRHLKTHSGEKSNKCNKCDFASSYVSALRTHLECTVEKSQTNATNATMHPLMQAVWEHIWKRRVEKSQTNATNVTLGNWSHETACKIFKWTHTRNPKISRVSPECVGDIIQST